MTRKIGVDDWGQSLQKTKYFMSKKFDYHLIMIEMSDDDNRFPHKNTVSDNNNGVLIVELFFYSNFSFYFIH